MSKPVYIIDAKRTAIGKYGGSLSPIPATYLASLVIKDIFSKLSELKDKIDEVILGNVLSAGLGQNPARIASIKAGLSVKIPAYTVNKVCGSGLKSVILGVQAIRNRDAQLIVAGGMENMSRCPYYLDNYRFGTKFGHQEVKDGMIYDGLFCSLIGEHMGMTAEYIAKRYRISREDQDKFAYESHQKAIHAIDNGIFKNEIVPIEVIGKKEKFFFRIDEQPRRDTSLERLSQLKPVFMKRGSATAGNSATINDGAAVVLLSSEEAIKKYHLKPKVIVRSYASAGLDPKYMGLGTYFAPKKCIKAAGLKISDIDLWELSEAFSSQSLVVLKLLNINPKIVNVSGGTLALGHPIGATGSIILATLISGLKRRKLQYGVASLCIGGGQGIAVLIENI